MDDLVNSSSKVGFFPDEMVTCAKCSKQNPPTRSDCFYCGRALEVAAGSENLKLKKAEIWENAFNLILPGTNNTIDAKIASTLLSLDLEEARSIIDAGTMLPIGRVSERSHAEHACLVFANNGVELLIVKDEDLEIKNPPRRIRRVDFDENTLLFTDFNTLKTISVDAGSVKLIVAGTIFKTRSDVVEVRAKKNNSPKDQTDLSSDEMVIDIYTKDDPVFRIFQSGFDFSGLGENKALLASENIRMLLSMLNESAENARTDTSYNRMRRLLEAVWPTSEHRDSRGIVKRSLGKMDLGSVKIRDNTEQFTRYSRLLNYKV